LIPRSRLSNDSARSPRTAAPATTTPKRTPAHHAMPASPSPTAPPAAAASSEPARPSHDFFGLTDGAIGCRPKNTPDTYPPVSVRPTATRVTSTRQGPSPAAAGSAANPPRNGT